jgi:hypothetical protein
VRGGLAQLGLRSLDELIGHADYLQQRDTPLAKTSESSATGSVTVVWSLMPSANLLQELCVYNHGCLTAALFGVGVLCVLNGTQMIYVQPFAER